MYNEFLSAFPTLLGFVIALVGNLALEILRQRWDRRKRTESAAIAAADSLNEFQRECLTKVEVLSSSENRDIALNALKSIKSPRLSLRDHPELLAALPPAEANETLRLLHKARNQDQRIEAMRQAEARDDRLVNPITVRMEIEKEGFAELVETAGRITESLRPWSGWPNEAELTGAAQQARYAAGAARLALAERAAANQLVALCPDNAAHAMAREPVISPWLNEVWEPILGTSVGEAFQVLSDKLREIETNAEDGSATPRRNSFDKASLAREYIEYYAKGAGIHSASVNQLYQVRQRVASQRLVQVFEQNVREQYEHFSVDLMRDLVEDPRELTDPVPSN